MRAFVTGSTGLLGNNLVRTLAAAGHEVLALARSPAKAARELGDTPARIVVGDLDDVAGFAPALEGVDVVFHAGAYFREYYAAGDHAAALARINVDASVALARAAQAYGVGRMVFTSSAGLVGLQPDGSPGTEQTPPWAGIQGNRYLRSKAQAEQRLQALAREEGLFVAFALPAWMWGPHDAAPTASGQLAVDAIRGRLPPAVPPGGAAVVDARDVAAAMLRIAESGRSGERYLLSAGYAGLDTIVQGLAERAGVAAPRRQMPFAAALALAWTAETWARLTRRPSALSVQSMRLMNARLNVSAAKAERELGVRFRPIAQTLADTVDWMARRLEQADGIAADAGQSRAAQPKAGCTTPG